MRIILKQFLMFVLIVLTLLSVVCQSQNQSVTQLKEFNLSDKAIEYFYKAHREDLVIPASAEYEYLNIYNEGNSEKIVRAVIHDFKGTMSDLCKKLDEFSIRYYWY